MGFTLSDYEDQKRTLDRQILILLGKHNVPSEDKLLEPRNHQVKFLRKCQTLLDAPVDDSKLQELEDAERNKILRLREAEKTRTFSGLMLMVKHEIDNYHLFKTGDNGVFAGGLAIAIGISEENVLDPNSAANMIGSAMKFLVTHSFERADTTKPLLENHPFVKIDGFKLKEFWDRGTDMQTGFRKQVMAESEAQRQKAIAEKQEVQTGYLSSLTGIFSGTKTKKVEEKLEVDVDFQTKTNSM